MYLKEIGKVPLLTAAEEIDLAMKIEAGVAAGEQLEKRRRRRNRAREAATFAASTRIEEVGFDAEAAAHRGKLAPCRVHRQALRGPRHAVPRPYPGGQPRSHPRGGEVRLHARASSSPRTPPGGFARPSRAPSPTRRAPSAFPCTWWRPSTSSCASSASFCRSSAASPPRRRSARRWGCLPSASARSRRSRRSR